VITQSSSPEAALGGRGTERRQLGDAAMRRTAGQAAFAGPLCFISATFLKHLRILSIVHIVQTFARECAAIDCGNASRHGGAARDDRGTKNDDLGEIL
jgi:hypothetical protein